MIIFNKNLNLICFLLIFKFKFSLANFIENEDGLNLQEKKIEENRVRCLTINLASLDSKVKKCPKVFDKILCWDETPAGQLAEQPCPEWFIGFDPKQKAVRNCTHDGTWFLNEKNVSYTNYKKCVKDDFNKNINKNNDEEILKSHLKRLKLIANIGSVMSMTFLILAIILLIGFKRLHCARNILHVNLFASFLLFSILQLIKETSWVNSLGFKKDLVILGNDTKYTFNPNKTHWECKTLMTFYRYSESSNHVMVFCEALYLNTLVSVSTFSESNHFKFYITAGWIGPLVWIIPFVLIMLKFGISNSCWNTETKFSYLYVIPQVALIFLNFGMFINIIRILKNKLRKNLLTESKHYRYKKLAKSTLILLPLFSIYYIAFSVWQPFVRGKLPLELELIRLYFEIICSSFQGLIISFIYCFFNSEVRSEIINQIERKLLQRYPNMRRFSSMITKERNYSVSVQNDRFKRMSCNQDNRINANLINKNNENSNYDLNNNKIKNQKINSEQSNSNNQNDLNLISKQNSDVEQNNNQKNKDSINNSKRTSFIDFFKKRKKNSNSTITSNFTASSKSSKGTIRMDSVEANNNNNNINNENKVKSEQIDSDFLNQNRKKSLKQQAEKENLNQEHISLLDRTIEINKNISS